MLLIFRGYLKSMTTMKTWNFGQELFKAHPSYFCLLSESTIVVSNVYLSANTVIHSACRVSITLLFCFRSLSPSLSLSRSQPHIRKPTHSLTPEHQTPKYSFLFKLFRLFPFVGGNGHLFFAEKSVIPTLNLGNLLAQPSILKNRTNKFCKRCQLQKSIIVETWLE